MSFETPASDESRAYAIPLHGRLGQLGQVCRLGLASRGGTGISADSVLGAVDLGVNYLNWSGQPDSMSEAIRRLGDKRRDVYVAVQIESRTAEEAERELRSALEELGTDYIDVATYYYVEHPEEWEAILEPGGAGEALKAAQAEGVVRMLGVTSHQRTLAARIAEAKATELLMIRYNAAHRGAENEVFPVTGALCMPVVAYTALRWGALLQPTPEDPAGFAVPRAPDWYRFVLSVAEVTVVLASPDSEEELREDLSVITDNRGLALDEYEALKAHGERVRRHAGQFP